MNRREMLRWTGIGFSALLAAGRTSLFGSEQSDGRRLGICVYALGIRSRAEQAKGNPGFADPLRLLEYCHGLGAGGIQTPLGVDARAAADLRVAAERYGMFVEGISKLPADEADVKRFDDELRTARSAGASVVRVVMLPGRRYEQFKSIEAFRQALSKGLQSLELAEPVAAKNRVRLALENHKDQRVPERLDVLRRLSSEWLGACIDVGNSFALLEDPLEVVRAYAPWAAAVHLKDQAVREYDEGFLLGDVALGDGFLDLAAMAAILEKANPAAQFSFETITRDPLKVPCLTEAFWATLRDVTGKELARTLRTVRANRADRLVDVSRLSADDQLELETENVKRSLAYAREKLGL